MLQYINAGVHTLQFTVIDLDFATIRCDCSQKSKSMHVPFTITKLACSSQQSLSDWWFERAIEILIFVVHVYIYERVYRLRCTLGENLNHMIEIVYVEQFAREQLICPSLIAKCANEKFVRTWKNPRNKWLSTLHRKHLVSQSQKSKISA